MFRGGLLGSSHQFSRFFFRHQKLSSLRKFLLFIESLFIHLFHVNLFSHHELFIWPHSFVHCSLHSYFCVCLRWFLLSTMVNPWSITIFHHHSGEYVLLFSKHLKQIQGFGNKSSVCKNYPAKKKSILSHQRLKRKLRKITQKWLHGRNNAPDPSRSKPEKNKKLLKKYLEDLGHGNPSYPPPKLPPPRNSRPY